MVVILLFLILCALSPRLARWFGFAVILPFLLFIALVVVAAVYH